MFSIAEFRGLIINTTKNGKLVGKAQFLINGNKFDSLLTLTVFNNDGNIEKLQNLRKGKEVILSYNQRLKNGYLESYFNYLIEDTEKVEKFKELVNKQLDKVPS